MSYLALNFRRQGYWTPPWLWPKDCSTLSYCLPLRIRFIKGMFEWMRSLLFIQHFRGRGWSFLYVLCGVAGRKWNCGMFFGFQWKIAQKVNNKYTFTQNMYEVLLKKYWTAKVVLLVHVHVHCSCPRPKPMLGLPLSFSAPSFLCAGLLNHRAS